MGGRGSSSGLGKGEKIYGTEFSTLYQVGNVKYISYNGAENAKTPMETITKNRIYAIVNARNEVKSITFYDRDNKRYKQIDIKGTPHKIDGERVLPHTHKGYNHDENGTYRLSPKEEKLVDTIVKNWYDYNSRQ